MGLISPGGENLLEFLELWQVLSTYDGDLIKQVFDINKKDKATNESIKYTYILTLQGVN